MKSHDPTPKLRIAIFTETFLPKIDGVVSILCLVLRRLNELGHDVILFGPPDGPPEYAGAEIVGVGGPRVPFYPELRVNIPGPRIWRRVKAFQPDIIHVVHPTALGVFGMNYARRLNVPILASFHTNMANYARHYGFGFAAPLLWGYARLLHNRADLTLSSSSVMRDVLRDQGFKRVRWWKRGIDTERFSPGPRDETVRAQMTDGHPNDFLLVNVGRQAPEKGLKSLRDNLFPQEGVRLALVGDGPSHEDLKAHYRDTPTVFPGYLRDDDLIAAYRAADAFVFPSTTETFGLVALEAMACGLPVIAAQAGGLVETVKHGGNGFLFDPERPQQIAAYVNRLRRAPHLRDKLAANALDHAHSRSWRATMDQLADYYRVAIRVHQMSETAVDAEPSTLKRAIKKKSLRHLFST